VEAEALSRLTDSLSVLQRSELDHTNLRSNE
jgi:hypothetical protein